MILHDNPTCGFDPSDDTDWARRAREGHTALGLENPLVIRDLLSDAPLRTIRAITAARGGEVAPAVELVLELAPIADRFVPRTRPCVYTPEELEWMLLGVAVKSAPRPHGRDAHGPPGLAWWFYRGVQRHFAVYGLPEPEPRDLLDLEEACELSEPHALLTTRAPDSRGAPLKLWRDRINSWKAKE
jgi:hypothetical protein